MQLHSDSSRQNCRWDRKTLQRTESCFVLWPLFRGARELPNVRHLNLGQAVQLTDGHDVHENPKHPHIRNIHSFINPSIHPSINQLLHHRPFPRLFASHYQRFSPLRSGAGGPLTEPGSAAFFSTWTTKKLRQNLNVTRKPTCHLQKVFLHTLITVTCLVTLF